MFFVTFSTNCWEKDWNILLRTKYLEDTINRNCFPFVKKNLIINTNSAHEELERYAKRMVDSGVLTEYYYVKDYAEEVLAYFNLSREGLGRGFVYSISELVSIYLCDTDYLVFFMGDARLEKECSWIESSINKMNSDPRLKVATLVWNKRYDEAKMEAFYEDNDFFTGYGFSDQCFLIRTKDFRASIYNEKNPISERYPRYGGESFEKRVDAWMRNHEYCRLVYKKGHYIHKNLPRNKIVRNLGILLGKWGERITGD